MWLHYRSNLHLHHDDVIKWKHFPRYWPFVRGIHRSPVNSPHKRPVVRNFDVFSDLRLNKRLSRQSWGHLAHYDVIVMQQQYVLKLTRALVNAENAPLAITEILQFSVTVTTWSSWKHGWVFVEIVVSSCINISGVTYFPVWLSWVASHSSIFSDLAKITLTYVMWNVAMNNIRIIEPPPIYIFVKCLVTT